MRDLSSSIWESKSWKTNDPYQVLFLSLDVSFYSSITLVHTWQILREGKISISYFGHYHYFRKRKINWSHGKGRGRTCASIKHLLLQTRTFHSCLHLLSHNRDGDIGFMAQDLGHICSGSMFGNNLSHRELLLLNLVHLGQYISCYGDYWM